MNDDLDFDAPEDAGTEFNYRHPRMAVPGQTNGILNY